MDGRTATLQHPKGLVSHHAFNVTIGKLKSSKTLTVKDGTSKFAFGGIWNKKKLKAGSYTE